jgi:hypothetical protein
VLPRAGLLMVLSSVVFGPTALAQVGQTEREPTLTHAEAVARLNRYIDLVGELRSHLDRSQFDLDSLLEKLDYDADNVINFVRDEIYFEQYPGLLRGAQGTLLSRAGNALDQAILAVTLLNDAGYDARVARGKLGQRDASILVGQIAAGREPRAPVGDEDQFTRITTEIQKLLPPEAQDLGFAPAASAVPVESTEPYVAAADTSRRLLGLLRDHGVTLGDDDSLSAIEREAQDYFWVEYRSTAAGPWTQAHPAFASSGTEPRELVAEQYLEGEVPAELQHRFRVQAFAGLIRGGECHKEPLMTAWERPVANVIGLPLSYVNLPDGVFTSPDSPDFASAVQSSDFYYPLLNWSPAGGLALHKSGLLVPVEGAASPQAGVFSTFANRGIEAASALQGLGNDSADDPQRTPPLALGAVWLDYTLIAPGGDETTFGRSLARTGHCPMAPVAGVTTSPGNLSTAELGNLVMEQAFVVAAGTYPDAFIVDRILESVLRMAPYLQFELDAQYAAADSDRAPRLAPHSTLDYQIPLLLYSVFDQGAAAAAIQYRASPSLIVLSRDVGGARNRLWLDIVNNARRTFRIGQEGLALSAADALKIGVWETYAEASFFDEERQSSVNAASLTDRAFQLGSEFELLTSGDTEPLQRLQLSPDQQAQVMAALDAGYAVIVPEPQRAAPNDFAWWKLDLRSGTALGMTADGRGAEEVNDLQLRSQIGGKIARAVGYYRSMTAMLAEAPAIVRYPCYAVILARTVFLAYNVLHWALAF